MGQDTCQFRKFGKVGYSEDGKEFSRITQSQWHGRLYELEYFWPNKLGKHYQVNDGKWRHLAVSVVPLGADSISVKLFLDGRQETQFLNKIHTSGIEFNTQPSDLTVGGYSFRGWIDDLRIYLPILRREKLL